MSETRLAINEHEDSCRVAREDRCFGLRNGRPTHDELASLLCARQALRRPRHLLPCRPEHRLRDRSEAARGHPRRLRQALPGMERQGRRPGLGTAAGVDAGSVAEAARRPEADRGAEGPHRRYPRGLRQRGCRQDDAQIVSSRRARRDQGRAIENLKTYLPTKWKDLQKGDDIVATIRPGCSRARIRQRRPATSRPRRRIAPTEEVI